jgi:hypothetical protein
MNFSETLDSKKGDELDYAVKFYPPWYREKAKRLDGESDEKYRKRLQDLFEKFSAEITQRFS